MREVTAVQSPSEQNICVGCGLCCGGTLHGTAVVLPDDEATVAAAKLEIADEGKRRVFRLPCPHLRSGSCSIYETRPGVCRTYRCALLINVESGNLSALAAREKIEAAKRLLAAFKSFAPEAVTPTERAAAAKRLQAELSEIEGPDRQRVAAALYDSVALERFLARWFLEEERPLLMLRGEAIEIDGHAVAFVGAVEKEKELTRVFRGFGRGITADGGFAIGFDGAGNPHVMRPSDRQTNETDPSAEAARKDRSGVRLTRLYVLANSPERSIKRIEGIEAADAIFANAGGSKGMGPQTHWLSSLRLVRSTAIFRASAQSEDLLEHLGPLVGSALAVG